MDSLREALHQRIDVMPDCMVHRLATGMDILVSMYANDTEIENWSEEEWQLFVKEQFFCDEEDDPVVYTLKDAQEVTIDENRGYCSCIFYTRGSLT